MLRINVNNNNKEERKEKKTNSVHSVFNSTCFTPPPQHFSWNVIQTKAWENILLHFKSVGFKTCFGEWGGEAPFFFSLSLSCTACAPGSQSTQGKGPVATAMLIINHFGDINTGMLNPVSRAHQLRLFQVYTSVPNHDVTHIIRQVWRQCVLWRQCCRLDTCTPRIGHAGYWTPSSWLLWWPEIAAEFDLNPIPCAWGCHIMVYLTEHVYISCQREFHAELWA